MNVQLHVVALYFAFVVLWGLSVDHPLAPLQAFGFLKWVSPVVIGVLALTVLRKARQPINVWGINLALGLLILWVVVSAIANRTPAGLAVAWILLYLKYPLFAVYLNNLSLRPGTAIALLQAVAWFALFLVVEGFTRTALGLYDHPDQISYVLGPHGHFIVGFVCSIAIIYLSAVAFVRRRFWCLALAVGLISVSIPGEIKALTIGGPLLIGVVYAVWARGMRLRIPLVAQLSKAAVGLAGLGLAIGFLFERFADPDTAQILYSLLENLGTWLREGGTLQEARLSRVSTIAEVVQQLRDHPLGLLAGLGPGTTFLAAGDAREGLVGHHSWNQIGMLLADVGVVGLGLYVTLLLSIVAPFWSLARRLPELDDSRRILVVSFGAVGFYYVVLAPLYDLAWRYDGIGYVFFVLASAAYRLQREGRAVEAGAPALGGTFPAPAAGGA
jgi:hypothetical protein